MAFLESPAERARKFREQQAGVKPAAPIAQPGIPVARPGSVAAPNAAAPRWGALPAVADWAMGRPEPKGFTPVMPDYTKPNPSNKPIMTTMAPPRPAVAAPPAPKPAAAVAPATAAVASPPAKKSPSQSMTLDQANAQEVNAQTARRPGTQVGAGASPAAGAAAPISKSVGKFGETVFSNTGSQYAPAAIASPTGTIGSVQSQNFGNAAVPQAQTSIARPGTASTFGMGVNDPRLNDQTPVISRPNAISGARYRGADQMAEQYNSREDREARTKLLSDLDSQRFRLEMIGSNPGRRGRAAIEALGDNAQQRAALVAGGEKLSADAIQNRGQRANQFDIAGMEQSGQDRRAQIDAGNKLQIAGIGADVERAKIARPDTSYITDAQNNYLRVTDGQAATVTDAAGNPIQMQAQAQQQKGVVTPLDVYKGSSDELNTLLSSQSALGGKPDPIVAQRIDALRQQIAALQPQAPQSGQAQTPTLDAYIKAARAAGFKESDEVLAATFKKRYQQAQ